MRIKSKSGKSKKLQTSSKTGLEKHNQFEPVFKCYLETTQFLKGILMPTFWTLRCILKAVSF
jgi:hypothetical protein